MPQPLAHLYDLALRALDEQERRADALRGRLGPMLAAAALGATLLSGPVVGGARPGGAAGTLAVLVALGGLAATVAGAFRVLRERYTVGLDLDPNRLARVLQHRDSLDDDRRYYLAMLTYLGEAKERNHDVLTRLGRDITSMLWGMLVMLCGLALAALVA